MTRRNARAVLLITACLLAVSACSVAPRGKTRRLPTLAPTATAKAVSPGSVWLKKANSLRLETLDQAGYFYGGTGLVCGWLDNDHLAAIGTKPIPQGTDSPQPATPEERKAIREKFIEAKRFSADGIIGQILSVDWRTLETTELHTAQDEVFTGIGLSHDKSMLWYISTDGQGASSLSMSDISFKHDLLDVQDYAGDFPAWSSQDKYLYFINYNDKSAKKSNPPLTLFDRVSTLSMPDTDLTYGGLRLIGVDDETGRVSSIIKSSAIVSAELPDTGKPMDSRIMQDIWNFSEGKKPLSGEIFKTAWVDAGYVLMMCSGKEAPSMGILDIGSGEPPYWYDGVLNFALSDDMKYICMVREAAGNTADVSVAQWQDGAIRNETTIFKGFIASEAIYFSPDSTKLFMQGRYKYSDKEPTALVLQFR